MKKLLVLLSCIYAAVLHAHLFECRHITDVLLHVEDEHSLIVFDIDNTLAQLEQELGGDQWFSALLEKKIKAGIDVHTAVQEILPLYIRLQNMYALVPVEPVTPFFIKDLQRQEFKVIALTARSLPLEQRTLEQLHALTIDFSVSGLCSKEIDLVLQFPCKHKKGIVFSGNNDKGKVLLALLDYVGYHPCKVIFVDDKEKNIRAVERAMEERGIPFVGLRYNRLDKKIAQFDLEKANKQLDDMRLI